MGWAICPEDHSDDTDRSELSGFIRDLNEDEQIDVVALTWLGRGDGDLDTWSDLRTEASRAHNNRTGSYLIGTPMLADYLGRPYRSSTSHLRISKSIFDPQALLRDPLLNKGTAFTEQERDALGLRGLLPAHVLSMKAHANRVLTNLRNLPDDLQKYVVLNALHDRTHRT